MDINENLDSDFKGFSLNPESRDYLITAAKWAKIIAISSLILIITGILGGFTFFFYGSSLFKGEGMSVNNFFGGLMGVYIILYMLMWLAGIIPFYYMYKFATETNAGLIGFKGTAFGNGILFLKSFFKITVLFMAIGIILYFISLGILFSSF